MLITFCQEVTYAWACFGNAFLPLSSKGKMESMQTHSPVQLFNPWNSQHWQEGQDGCLTSLPWSHVVLHISQVNAFTRCRNITMKGLKLVLSKQLYVLVHSSLSRLSLSLQVRWERAHQPLISYCTLLNFKRKGLPQVKDTCGRQLVLWSTTVLQKQAKLVFIFYPLALNYYPSIMKWTQNIGKTSIFHAIVKTAIF